MTGTEEASARKGNVEPRILWRKMNRKYFRKFSIAAVAAAVFVCAASQPVAAHMGTEILEASSSLQSLISTICWLVGFGFAVNGGIKVFRASRIPVDDPRHAPLWRRGLLYLFLGFGCISYPFVEASMSGNNEYRAGTPQVVSASGCFQSAVPTALGLMGLYLIVSGGFRYLRSAKMPRNDILYDRLVSSAQRRLLAGTLMILLPFVQSATQQSIYESRDAPGSDAPLFDWLGFGFFVAGVCRLRSAARFPENSPERIWRRNQGLAYIILFIACICCPLFEEGKSLTAAWYYFAFMSFLIAEVNLRHALRLKDDPVSAATPRLHAAACFAAGFAFLGAPAFSAMLAGF